MKLTAENVEEVIVDCLFKDGEVKDQAVIVEGITHKFGFHPDRLNNHKENIHSMLKQLPDSFQKDSGGGMSFLHACNDKDGNQWTGLHKTMDGLFVLGFATEQAELCLPREMWDALPGGMPYIVVK